VPDADVQLASWVQAGGVVAFATAVLLELRAMRPVLGEIKTVLAALLERDRIRDTRRRSDSSGPHYARPPTRPEWSDGETTDLHQLAEMKRQGKSRSTPAHGVRSAQPGRATDRPFDDE
jgi:hypothetical protein